MEKIGKKLTEKQRKHKQERERMYRKNNPERMRAISKRSYEKNKNKAKIRDNIYRDRRAILIAYFGGTCMDCGGTFPTPCFDFHHRDTYAKKFTLTMAQCSRPWDKLVEEANKCDLICANCHRLRHLSNKEWYEGWKTINQSIQGPSAQI